MKKIAFSGIPAGGKTAIATEVKKILGLKFQVAEVEDIYRRSPYDIGAKNNFSSQFFFLTTQVNEENIRSFECPDVLLCDRSVLDQWVYWQKIYREKGTELVWRQRHAVMKALYRFWIKTYDIIFHIRLDWHELEKRRKIEEFVDMDRDYVQAVEELFLTTIKKDRLKTVEIWNNLSVDESAHKVIAEINALKLL